MGTPTRRSMPMQDVSRIAAVRGVAAASPQLYLESLAHASCCSVSSMFVVAFDPATDFTLQPWLEKKLGGGLAPYQAVGGAYVYVPPGQGGIKLYGSLLKLRANLAATGTNLDQSLFITFATAREVARLPTPKRSSRWSSRKTACRPCWSRSLRGPTRKRWPWTSPPRSRVWRPSPAPTCSAPIARRSRPAARPDDHPRADRRAGRGGDGARVLHGRPRAPAADRRAPRPGRQPECGARSRSSARRSFWRWPGAPSAWSSARSACTSSGRCSCRPSASPSCSPRPAPLAALLAAGVAAALVVVSAAALVPVLNISRQDPADSMRE